MPTQDDMCLEWRVYLTLWFAARQLELSSAENADAVILSK